MAVFERSSRTERELKWAKIWFSQLATFHQRQGEANWQFSKEDVIAFSRAKLKKSVPAWKRLKMVQGLISYRKLVQNRAADDLRPIHNKLQEIVARERATDAGARTIEEVVGKIDPREPDVIQEYRRVLRLLGEKYSTERAYVGKLFAHLEGVPLVIAKLLYGCGMRISEALRLRVKDIDFGNSLIEIHQSKGGNLRP